MNLRNSLLSVTVFAMATTLPLLGGCNDPMRMSFTEFDQTPGQGWRELAEEKEYAQAGQLIDEYRMKNLKLGETKRAALAFHAGQMYVYAGQDHRALVRFRTALLAHEPATFPIRWNAYVKATIAFLQGEKQDLLLQRHIMAEGPRLRGRVVNLDIVDQLIENFGKPYPVAYEAHAWKRIPASVRAKVLDAPTQLKPQP